MRRLSGGFLITFLLLGLLFAESATTSWHARYYHYISVDAFARLAISNQVIDLQNVDYPLLHAAIFYETNKQRLRYGLPVLKYSPYLEKAAATHSEMMALLQFYSHQSYPGSNSGIDDRLAKMGITYGTMGENLADAFAIQYEAGRTVYTPDQNGGYFSYQLNGKPIKAHTYLSFAKMIVANWMQSDGHRDNILCEHYQYMGVGASHYKNRDKFYIDQFKVTQNFSSLYGGQYQSARAGD